MSPNTTGTSGLATAATPNIIGNVIVAITADERMKPLRRAALSSWRRANAEYATSESMPLTAPVGVMTTRCPSV